MDRVLIGRVEVVGTFALDRSEHGAFSVEHEPRSASPEENRPRGLGRVRELQAVNGRQDPSVERDERDPTLALDDHALRREVGQIDEAADTRTHRRRYDCRRHDR